MEVREHPMLERLPSMSSASNPHNARNHATAECHELRKALHELADNGQIDHFLKRGPCFLWKEHEPTSPESREEECSTEVVATIAGVTQKALPGLPGKHSFGAPSKFSQRSKGLGSPYQQRCSVEAKLHILPLRTTIRWEFCGYHLLGLPEELNISKQERHPSSPSNPRDKGKAMNVEVDFLVVDVPMAYNSILRWPTLHKVEAVIAPYLLQLQFEADDGSLPIILTSPSSAAPWPSPSGVPTSPSRGVVTSSLRSSPLTKARKRNLKGSEHGIAKKRREENGPLLTPAMDTSSSVTLKEPEGARSWTNAYLAAGSATRKFVGFTRALAKASSMAEGAICGALRVSAISSEPGVPPPTD
ncbi:hypothetical protein Cgig2_010946 [Carnegiea gigantea]|uniref:Uncharacterized protein n=1 Tax=Carnegiea gigantea TaxID=171969 RepID=A0A9Q1K054_9CARY|nr:hypothetical protein Cgig2_010946 [Carnegiea gigantea]